MAFSVRPPTPAPPSLRNMYKALKKDYPSFVEPANRGGLLTPWADRGVLMLNTCLTVRAHDAFSHANRGWERFTQRVIELIAKKRTRGVVFMAWGVPAGKRVQKIDRQRHLILESVHPSPLSASRGFFDCRHFRSSNEWLISRYGPDAEIDWALKPGNTTKEAPPAPPAAPAAAAPAEAPAAEADAAATTTPSKDAAAPAPEPASASPTPKKAEDKLKTEDKSKPEEQSKPEDKPKANDKVKTQEKTKDEANKENGPAGEEEFDSGDEDALEEALRLAEGAATKPA